MARKRERGWPPAPEALPLPVVDDHTHLESIAGVLPDVDEEGRPVPVPTVEQHVEDAARVGVDRMVQVGCDLRSARLTDALVREHRALVGAIAIHPNEATLHAGVTEVGPDGLTPAPEARHAVGLDDAITEIAAIARGNDRIRAIGETGMDLFRTGAQGAAVQRESFRAHVALAKELGLPLQIHDRDAHAEVIDVLLADGAPERTVFHCFSGDVEMARLCAAQGWYLSFAGPVTFGANDELRAALAAVPLAQVLVETDAPYLTPHPYRGRPNAPYLLPHTVRKVAEVTGVPLVEVCAQLSTTAEQVYGSW
ncbi:TatD family deoxyribonuclease [Oerskovia turbata]|uniref:TatD family deoxyribonuclease n=1 Tax=Oerskovia turbata TaxID=1713 RepID=A0A4Q1KWQ9_9CELL|nr:TatD family hydrolase [Oerskovia turbata]RXR26864.1 TatD family deoxyribonuclease [Oerskovia turbata]RXR34597.1 TatD family deoxyribonuclease [Oerskovia turbata]TGJ97870.1 TatD family deoxyribonuclease [Actinotalea fermentans ATCC 43279 = JCM 9966 = DSM 3133]